MGNSLLDRREDPIEEAKRKKQLTILAVAVAALIVFAIIVGPKEKPNQTTPTQPTAVKPNSAVTIPATPARPVLSPEQTREKLSGELLTLISVINPHLNFIKAKTTKIKGGYALWLVHEYFTENTFSIGDDAKAVQAWINRSRDELKHAGVVRVGLQNTNGYLGSCWLDLAK